jgi:hypothetical protein
MRFAARNPGLAGLAVILIACSDRSALERQADAASNQRLIGIWDVRFQLERPLFGSADSGTVNHYVRGELAFLANRWVTSAYPTMRTATAYGSYDVDFTPFGFDPRSNDETPTALAGWLSSDSLEIIIGDPESDVSVTMDGRIAGDSIAGGWRVLIARSGGSGGRFVMVRHR